MGNVSPHFLTKESELYYIICSHWGKENKESNQGLREFEGGGKMTQRKKYQYKHALLRILQRNNPHNRNIQAGREN